jgi:outer membrane receptor protein involved in Fe transport
MNHLRSLALFPLAASLAMAQAASPASSPSDDGSPDVVSLSPFTVNAERDTGYQAQSTLAGTRLATPLRDLGASISVYTQDFMTDIGANNVNELLIYATGMDAAGSQGNFSGATNNIGATEVIGDGPRTNPSSGTRTRGLAGPERTRGYFTTGIGFDGYNTSSVTVSRGPNAVLFGAGSPAGVVDSTPIAADLRRNQVRIENRVGDNSSMRNMFDLNQVLWKDRLGVRLAALEDKERFDQRPAYDDQRRLYGTLSFQPFRSTRLRTAFETGKIRANRPITVLPFDSTTLWFAEKQPTFDWTFFDDPARNPSAATQNASANRPASLNQGQLFNVAVIPFGPGGGPAQLGFRGDQPSGNGLNRVRSNIFHPVMNRDSRADTIQFYETTNVGETASPASLFPGGVRPVGLKMQGFTDYSAFPFHKQMIDETSFQNDDFRTFSIALEQSGWKDGTGQDRVGVELAYYNENLRQHFRNQFFSQPNGNHIRVDANVTLADGRPNLNFGRPYAAGGNNADNRFWEDDRETYRATAYIRYDFREHFPELGKWLGRHTLTGLYEESSLDRLRYNKRIFVFGNLAESLSSNPVSFSRRANFLAYIGPSTLTTGRLQLEPIRNIELGPGTARVSYFLSGSDNSVQGNLTTEDVSLVELLNGGNRSRRLMESEAIVLQSYWLQDHLITTVGGRKDSEFQQNISNFTYTNYPNWKGSFSFDDFPLPSKPPAGDSGTTGSFGAVLRWPQRLIRLPQGMDASLFYNQSDNFTPSGTRITAYGDTIPSPKGETEEYGFSLSFFDDRFYLRVSRFETSVLGQSFNSNPYVVAYNQGVRQVAENIAAERNSNPGIDRTPQINAFRAAVPAFFDLVNFRLVGDGTPGNLYEALVEPLPSGITDTTDFVARGTELELVYNPTRNWRILVNVAKQETIQSNLAPNTKEFIDRMIPVWERYGDEPRFRYPTGWVPGEPVGETLRTWTTTNILVPYATLLAQEGQVSAEQRKWRANLVTNYTFGNEAGFLKGVGVGTGVRWQDKYALGYPTSLKPNGSIFVDIENPYWSDDDLNADAWVSYRRRIFSGKVDWRVQLNVKNLIGDNSPLPITVQPDGSYATTRLPPEKRIYLTNSFSF